MLSVTDGGTFASMARTASSTASLAITRYVVYFPPATTTSPGTGCATACSRDSFDGGLRLAGQQRPQPGVHALDVLVGERLLQHAR